MWSLLSAPKALLPPWLLAGLAVLATLVGCAVHDDGAPTWLAVVITALPSWIGAFGARRWLAGRVEPIFDELPSVRSVYGRWSNERTIVDLLTFTAWFATGALGYFAARALGVGGGGIAFATAAEILAGVAAAPVVFEVDARYALWLGRERQAEEQMIEAGAASPAAPPVPGPPPSGERLAHTVLTVPLHRVNVVALATGALGLAAICAGVAADAEALTAEIIAGAVLVPFSIVAAWQWARDARTPYFLRLARAGVDPLGGGVIPWEAIVGVKVVSRHGFRWLVLVLRDPVGGQQWATPELLRLAKRTRGDGVQLPLLYSAWPAVAVAAALREDAGVAVAADLAG